MTTADASPLGLGGTREGSEVVVAGYRVERLLRRHSAADAVYLASDVDDEGRSAELRVVALAGDPDLRARFAANVVRPSSIAHPHLPEVYDSGEAKQGLYLATARLKGRTLAELAARGGLSPLRAIRLLGGVADALDAVHDQGLAHGDVRLENMILVEGHVERPYLVDFALEPVETDDVSAFAACLDACLGAEETPPALARLVARGRSGEGPRSAGELMREAAQTLVSVPTRAPAAVEPAETRAWWRRGRLPRSSVGARLPGLAALAIVLAAGAAGFFLGRPEATGSDSRAAASTAGVSVVLPADWKNASAVPRVRGLDLAGAVAAAPPGGRPALVAGFLRGLRGSVYPAAVAVRVDPSPPRPRPVSLSRYEALRFAGLEARGSGRLTLFVVPTSRGTLAAACLPGAPPACERSAASLELSDADPSALADGERFAGGLDRVLRSLERRSSTASRRLRSAPRSGAQERAARELARAYRLARGSLLRIEPSPAARAARQALASSLSAVAAAYARLGRAAARRQKDAFADARRSVRRSEAELRSLLHGL